MLHFSSVSHQAKHQPLYQEVLCVFVDSTEMNVDRNITMQYQKTGDLHEKPVPRPPQRALLHEDISNAIKCAKHLL